MTNSDFLSEIYGSLKLGTHGWVCSFRESPEGAPSSVWMGRAYKGLPAQAGFIDRAEHDNTYYCTPIVTGKQIGRAHV